MSNIEVYDNTDVYINQNMGQSKGFSLKIPFEKMKEKVENMECNILVKTASRWYIKKGLYQPTINFLLFNQRKKFYPKITTYVFKNSYYEY
jgi:hypothetical protein